VIRLTSAAQAQTLKHRIPPLAVLRMAQFEGTDGLYDPERHGHIVVLEPGDDVEKDFPEAGPGGLLSGPEEDTVLFDYVFAYREGESAVYEAVIQIDDDRTLTLIIPDAPWLHTGLRFRLEALAEIA